MWGMYPRPKDSNAAFGVRDQATGKVLEGLTDRQSDRFSTHYSKTFVAEFSNKSMSPVMFLINSLDIGGF